MTPPLQVVVMGVSGCGKSLVAREIAAARGWDLAEGDDHHPPSNIDRMSQGVPLRDEDRRPWLEHLARLLAAEHDAGRCSVMACSALRRSYRDILRGDLPGAAVFFLHLDVGRHVLEQRLTSRDHFMPVSLLRSQLEALEPLEDDELGLVVDAGQPLEAVLAAARAALAAYVD